ncbi:MAG TPA: glycosyltransferase family 9 protein [Paraburkholderia sp.]|jgi:ADP-heptose:LPS heptosyltransferase|nr:glycosyltransferase family 9 protein [Paraburkholderia sp.]
MTTFIDAVAPRRIAVFRALQLGDLLCSVPALRALRAALPDAHITLIGLPWARAFAARYAELIDAFDAFPGARGFPEQAEDEAHLSAFVDAMRARRFDLAIQLHGSGGIANALVARFGARALAGFSQPGETPPRGLFVPWPDTLPEPERYNVLMRAMGVDAASAALSFPLTPEDVDDYDALAARHGLHPERLVLVHPGAQLPSRRWPADRFAAVADDLAADGWQIAVTGTAAEVELTAQVVGAMVRPAQHLAGETSLGSLAALVAHARLVVCNDTGLSHVAAAMRTRSVVVASGSDTRRWAPLDHDRHHVLADWPACRPCMFRDCPYGHPCALNIGIESVAAHARAQLRHAADASAFNDTSPPLSRAYAEPRPHHGGPRC